MDALHQHRVEFYFNARTKGLKCAPVFLWKFRDSSDIKLKSKTFQLYVRKARWKMSTVDVSVASQAVNFTCEGCCIILSVKGFYIYIIRKKLEVI